MNCKPLVSICIPLYNNEKYIEDCIFSCLNQTYENIEIIISDNCSNDGSYEKISKFKDNIKIFKNDIFVKMTQNWNVFKSKINGDYIIFLCSDDILEKNCVLNLVNICVYNVDVIFFEYNFLRDCNIINKENFYKNSALIPSFEQHKLFLFSNNYPLSAAFIKKTAIDYVGWFDETYDFCPDWQLWLKLTSISKDNYILYCCNKLALYRQHSTSETNRCIKNKIAVFEVERMSYYFLNNIDLSHDEYADLKNKILKCLFKLTNSYSKLFYNNNDLELFYLELAYKYKSQLKLISDFNLKNGPPYDTPKGSICIDLLDVLPLN